jgi:MYXO-CTERM domain-containing protein
MRNLHSSRSRSLDALRILFAFGVAAGCTPQTTDATAPENMGLAADPSALSGEFKTYVADYFDGRPGERYHTLRQANGNEIRLHFDAEPSIMNGEHIYIRGEAMPNQALHVSQFDLGPTLAQRTSALEGDNPDQIAAPLNDTYVIVLVDTGNGVDITAAAAQARLNGTGTGAQGSFAQYYSESSYGKYTISPNSMVWPTTISYAFASNCDNPDTSAMAKAVDAALPTGMFNHVIMYFTRTSVCGFGGLGEEGSSVRPSKHTWMNGSLSCVVLMQEPGHNIGLMHANQMKCGTSAFSATPATACTITEYANSMSTMGSGCKTLSGYERMYEQWMNGCNAVNTGTGSGTFNLMPLETPCGGGIQTLQVPFPAALTVSDPQAGANTMVSLKNYYLDLRVAAGTFDAYGNARGQGTAITFTAPTVFIYTSDNVRNPTQTTRNGVTSLTQQSSVWTELLNTTPSGTTFTGLTAAGQSFTDPAGGPTITLMAISAAGATVQVTSAGNANPTATCLDGTMPPTSGGAMGSTTCGAVTTSDGGIIGTGGAPGIGGNAGGMGGRRMDGGVGMGGMTGTGMGGMTATGTGGMTTTGGGGSTGTAGNGGPDGIGGSTGVGGKGAGEGPGGVTGGCGCSVPSSHAPAWASIFGLVAVGLLRRRRRG